MSGAHCKIQLGKFFCTRKEREQPSAPMMSDMMSAMARGFGASMGESILAGVAESRDGFRKAARDAKPPDKRPHPFDADACHRFDELAAHAETAGLSGFVDELTDLIACGKLTETAAHAQLWPPVAVATSAEKQYTWPHPWRTRAPSLNDAMARYDENGKYSLANQLAVLVNPRWEALKDLGNAALKAGEPRVAVVWYERAASLTDANITAMAFFKALGGAAEHTAAARLASAEGDLRDVILRFLPDGPRVSVPFDADGQAKAAARGVPPEGTEPNLPRATCLANAAAALLKAGEPEVCFRHRSWAAIGWPGFSRIRLSCL